MAMLLSWQKEYMVGVPQIDKEHQYLFALINEFHDKHASVAGPQRALAVLNRLVDYAKLHFRHEEELMLAMGYPLLPDQLDMHDKLYSSVSRLCQTLQADPSNLGPETIRFLKGWMIGHIVNEDMRIGDFLRDRVRQAQASRETATA